MSWKGRVLEIGARVPWRLRQLRARMLLRAFAAHMGVGEVRCTACSARGTLAGGSWERCPVCMGFQEVPRKLDTWFKQQMLRMQREADQGLPAESLSGGRLPPVRFGVAGELAYRVSESDLFETFGAALETGDDG